MKTLSIAILLVAINVSCEEPTALTDTNAPDLNEIIPLHDFAIVKNYSIPTNHIHAFQTLGFGGYDVIPVERYDQKTERKVISYIVDGDIEIDVEHLLSLSGVSVEGRSKQYRTTITATPRLYKISTGALMSAQLKTALRQAVENYNNLNIGIQFEVKFPEDYGSLKAYQTFWHRYASILVQGSDLPGDGGGYAGFPYSDGRPYRQITIDYQTAANYGLDVAEHVLTHELGHCIGLRHTDFFNRGLSGCRVDADHPANEGDAGVGAIHIPGTPAMTGVDFNSIMMACFNGTETGEFSNFDIVALNALF